MQLRLPPRSFRQARTAVNGVDSTIIAVTITSAVTVIGFVVSYCAQKRNFTNELRKLKINKGLEKIELVINDLIKLIDGFKTNPKDWYKLRLKDFNSMPDDYFDINNDIVREFELQNFLLMEK